MVTGETASSAQERRATGPHAGKRLSPWRVMLGILIAAAAGVAIWFGFHTVTDRVVIDPNQPWFAAYVDTTLTPAYAFESPASAADEDVVLGFVIASEETTCEPSWGGAYTLDQAARDLDLDRRIARLRQQGGDVVVSFGGRDNTELAAACPDAESLAAAYRAVIDRYDLTIIDLDVEGDALQDTAVGARRAEALRILQSERDADDPLTVWLTLPVTPSGLDAAGEAVAAQVIDAGVQLGGINAMTMDYGVDLDGRTMGDAAISAVTGVRDQLVDMLRDTDEPLSSAAAWARIGATPMIGQNDVVDEVFTMDDAAQLNQFALDVGLGRVSMWSANRDRSCGDNYADVRIVSNYCSGVDQGQESFAVTLGDGLTDTGTAGSHTPVPLPSASATDDPATSPYPIWNPDTRYLAGSKIVWHGMVYEAKWWTRGDVPDDPMVSGAESPWDLVGPVLPGETPYVVPMLPPGTYPDWSGDTVYHEGDRVLYDGVLFEAKWWTQGDSPAAASDDPDGSPWIPLTAAQIEQIAGSG